MIEGARVRLRSRRPSDVPYAARWHTEAYEVPLEPSTYERMLLTIEDKETGTPIGAAGLTDGHPIHRRAKAFVVGDEAYRGDALRALCRFGFDTRNLAKVEIEVVADDTAAIAAYERLGFVREVHRRRALWIDGAWHDEYLMGVLREELR